MVYNLEIEENHTYYVSADEVLVHNMCKVRKKAGKKSGVKDSTSLIHNGRISVDDIKANPKAFSGKSAEEIAQMLRDAGYDVTIKNSTRSRSGAQIIQINNPGNGKNISQIQESPGGR